jgi:sugar lactone lactonase YvrE
VSTAERFTEVVTHHGEGPFWDATRGRLLLVDMLAGAIVAVDGQGAAERHRLSKVATVIRARRDGGYLLAAERRLLLLDPDLREEAAWPEVFDDASIRMNEGGCDPQGRFYIGTMAYDQTPGAGTVYRIEPDGSAAVVMPGVTISNGLQWNAAGDTAFYNDTPTDRVQAFDFDPDAGTFANGRTFATIDGPGGPDGMAIDVEDGIWVALFGGSAVHRYDATGALTEVVEVPGATQVTACTFGGEDRRTLFLTTSRENLKDGDQPEAGSVFRYEAGVAGAVPHPFAG